MAVQYKANARTKTGGAGSGSWAKNDKGPIKTNLTGYRMVARVFFQPIDDPAPGNHSPSPGKSPTSVPKTELETN